MDRNNNQPKTLKDNILGKIKQGDIKMHSRSFFAWQAAAVIAAIALTLLLGILVSSYLAFLLHASGRIFLPSFGWRGLSLFLLSFPWLWLLAIAAAVVLLEILIKRFSYRRPFIYSLGLILVVLGATGTALGQTSLHPFLFNRAQQNQLPIAGSIYQQFKQERVEDIHRGIVKDFSEDSLTIQTEDNKMEEVVPETKSMLNDLKKGDEVFVLGKETDEKIRAFGIKNISRDQFFRKIHKDSKKDDGQPKTGTSSPLQINKSDSNEDSKSSRNQNHENNSDEVLDKSSDSKNNKDD